MTTIAFVSGTAGTPRRIAATWQARSSSRPRERRGLVLSSSARWVAATISGSTRSMLLHSSCNADMFTSAEKRFDRSRSEAQDAAQRGQVDLVRRASEAQVGEASD